MLEVWKQERGYGVMIITAVEIISVEALEQSGDVYTFEVESCHTFYAHGFLVHNPFGKSLGYVGRIAKGFQQIGSHTCQSQTSIGHECTVTSQSLTASESHAQNRKTIAAQ